MKRFNTHISLLLLLSALVATSWIATSCQSEDSPYSEGGARTGRIVLSLHDVELFTEVITRATGNIDDYSYTLNGTDVGGNAVSSLPVTFTDGSAIVPAGTYTLTVTSKSAKDEAPWYEGTSGSFTIGVGGSAAVSINLGAPKNAKIDVVFDDSFTKLYENYSLTIGEKVVTSTAYVTPGEVTYTIKASAKADSHVSDLPAEGVTTTLTVEAGKSYTLNITANTISDLLMGFGEGIHSGAFDAKRR
ncbi:MAG: DUF4493 domain-containing protein [Bacteroidaceae bacterium]|nr:DUF4493 domain-containing protein [Bacteroidaceae bacterium]